MLMLILECISDDVVIATVLSTVTSVHLRKKFVDILDHCEGCRKPVQGGR